MAKENQHRAGENAISDRHRTWGATCFSTDIDLLLLEYRDRGRLCALVDFKAGLQRQLEQGELLSLTAIAELGDRADLPAYLVKYETEPWRFAVYPMNARARGIMPYCERAEIIDEWTFVRHLYAVRGRPAPRDVLEAVAG